MFFRNGINENNQIGDTWLELGNEKFTSVSCGKDGMLVATATNNRLWYRQGITMTKPQGESWSQDNRKTNVLQVTVGEEGYVFATSTTANSVYVRIDPSEDAVYGTEWAAVQSSQSIVQINCGKGKLWGINQFHEIFYHTYDFTSGS